MPRGRNVSLNIGRVLNSSYNGTNSAFDGRKNGQSDSGVDGVTTEKILGLMKENAGITIKEIAAACGITDDDVYYQLKRVKLAGLIKRGGSRKNGRWVVAFHD